MIQKIIFSVFGFVFLFLPVAASAQVKEKTMTGQIQGWGLGSGLGTFQLCIENGDCLSFSIYYDPDTTINGRLVSESHLGNLMFVVVKYHIDSYKNRVADTIKTL